ncbi:MAG: polymer-forming cytoskeletal protein [Hyphomicrobiaceae bacterium]
MFTKKPDKEPTAFDLHRPAPPPVHGGPMAGAPISLGRSSGGKAAQSTIGADLVIVGNLISKGEVHVDGEVQGDLHAVSIVIGDSAKITGGLVADEIVIRGTVMGSVRGKNVMLQSSSRVEGDIFHTQLAIEQGAYFEGKSRRSDDPIGGVQRPDGAMSMGQS